MKIIEALKQEKQLLRKIDDLKRKIAVHSAHYNYETPVYENQKQQVKEWLQACKDLIMELEILREKLHKTNLETQVTIELPSGKSVTKSIARWIHRRKILADLECSVYDRLTDKGLKEEKRRDSNGQEVEIKIVRCYDVNDRDNHLSWLSDEPSIIDSKLEITNAVVDIIE